jgi:large subunit ribosomal protein L21
MYAVIKSGGKQHRVTQGETLRLEKLDIPAGSSMDFSEVLMIGQGDEVKIGTPLVEGSSVTAEVLSHGRDDKVKIIKFRRRKHSRKQQGHRQWFTEVKITSINAG